MPNILFVCTANQFRSPIAEACFSRKLAQLQWKTPWAVQSAGTRALPGSPVLPIAAAIGHRLGLSLDRHRAALITPALVSVQDLILVMDLGHKEALQNEFPLFSKRIMLLSEAAHGTVREILDPVRSDELSFLDAALEICQIVDRGFYRICGEAMKIRRYELIAA